MHGAAHALANARLLRIDLRHHRVQIPALGEIVPMTAVGTGDHVGIAQMRADTGGDGFLADIKVHGPWYVAGLVLLTQPLFSTPDQQHPLVQSEQLTPGRTGVAHGHTPLQCLPAKVPATPGGQRGCGRTNRRLRVQSLSPRELYLKRAKPPL